MFCLCVNVLSAKEYHVSVKGSDANNGDISSPFKTINWAAQKALPGDTVTVILWKLQSVQRPSVW